MRLYDQALSLPTRATPCLIAMGNFDGVHRGHQALLAEAAAVAKARELPFVIVTFEPHPRQFFQPEPPLFRLTPWPLKKQLLSAYADEVIALDFNADLAGLDATDFARQLITALQVQHIVVGQDFAFGRGRGGHVALLQELLGADNITAVDLLACPTGRISSSRIREAVQNGDLTSAEALLGREFAI